MRLLKPLRLWPLAKAERIPLAEKLASFRTFDDEEAPRGSLDLAESISRLEEKREEETFPRNFQEPSVDPDLLYDRLFKQCPLMKEQETRALIRSLSALRSEERRTVQNERYRELRGRIICGHVRLCARVIKHFGLHRKRNSLTWTDLMQEGIFGLARAIDRFDINRGTRFSTYAFHWIRQAINRAIENKDRLIRIPAHYWRGKSRLPECEWRRLNTILSLSVNDHGIARALPDARAESPSSELIQGDLKHAIAERIEECLLVVNKRWREILERRFGLGGHKAQTLQEIADDFGLTRERVRQLEDKAIEKIRKSRKLEQFQEIIFEESYT